eukprot:gene2251-26414_t
MVATVLPSAPAAGARRRPAWGIHGGVWWGMRPPTAACPDDAPCPDSAVVRSSPLRRGFAHEPPQISRCRWLRAGWAIRVADDAAADDDDAPPPRPAHTADADTTKRAAPPPAGGAARGWTCVACTLRNAAGSVECGACGQPRPQRRPPPQPAPGGAEPAPSAGRVA